MPPLARIAALIAVLALPAGLFGQGPVRDGDPPAQRREFPRLSEVLPAGFQTPAEPDAPRDKPGGGQAVTDSRSPSDAETPPKTALAASDRGQPTPLAPPGQSAAGKGGHRTPGGWSSIINVGGSLAVVLGLFFILAWAMRRTTPGQCGVLPREAFEVLGRAPLANRQQVFLVRLGGKLVLLSVTPAGVEALSEVTDPAEVDRLAGICCQAQPGSSTSSFRQVLQGFDGRRREGTRG